MNEQSRAALIEHLKTDSYKSMSAEQAHAHFHSAMTTTVVEQKQKEFEDDDILSAVGDASLRLLVASPLFDRLLNKIDAQDAKRTKSILKHAARAGLITADEATACVRIVNRKDDVSKSVVADAPIVAVLYGIRDSSRPNAIPLDEFTGIFKEARQ